MDRTTEAWLDDLGARLPRHAALLRHLVEAAESDPRIRTFMVGCSIGRGAADELSDVDAQMSVVDDAWPEVIDDIDNIVRGAGEPVEVLSHLLPGVSPDSHRHVFVQYPDGVQLSLVVQPLRAQSRRGRAPDVVPLHDPDDRLGVVVEPGNATATDDERHEWCVLAWWALDDVAKYVRRGSPWEALERLHAARTNVWQLWAAAEHVASPSYGVTAILDDPRKRLPDGIEATVPRLDLAEIAVSARACAALLDRIVDSRPPIAAFVAAKLAALAPVSSDRQAR